MVAVVVAVIAIVAVAVAVFVTFFAVAVFFTVFFISIVGFVCLVGILLHRHQGAVKPVGDVAGEVMLRFVRGRGKGNGAFQIVIGQC